LEEHGLSAADDGAGLLDRVSHLIARTMQKIDGLRRVEQIAFVGGTVIRRSRSLTDAELEEGGQE
jgi:hypothetical protein